MPHNQTQLKAYRGVLKNKNLSKVVAEGLAAPLGSTKRKRAEKMLSIVKKTTHDGKGGPGPRMPRVNVQYRPQEIDYSNLLILPPTPPIRVPFGESAPTPRPPRVHDGAGGPGPAGAGYTLNLGSKAPSMGGGLVIPPYQPSVTSRLAGGLSNIGRAIGSNPATMGATMFGLPAVQDMYSSIKDGEQRTYALPGLATANSSAQTRTLGKAPAATPQTASQPYWGVTQPPKVDMGAAFSGIKLATDKQSMLPPGTTPEQTTDPAAQFPGMTGGIPGATESATSGLPSRFAGVTDAVNNATGPSTFAYDALMQGGDKLKSLMPGASSSMLEGGGLNERMNRIDSALRKTFGLDQLKDQLTQMVMGGQNLEGRLTDYIRGRDEFLNETEDMIGDLKRRSMKADMSDPRTRSNMQQHMDYLYELRGRQNKRYVEFLKMSTDAYDAKVGRAQALYDGEYSKYADRLASDQAIAKEEYNVMYTGLQEMYNTVAGAAAAKREQELHEAELAKTYLQIAKDTRDLEGSTSGDAIKLNSDLKALGIIGENGEWVANNNALTLAGTNVSRLPELMEEGVARAFYTYDKEGNSAPKSIDQALYITQNALGHLAQLASAGIITGDDYAARQRNIKNQLQRFASSNQSFISTDQVPSYRKAVETLAGDGWLFNRSTPSRDDFVKKWTGEGLNGAILNSIYTDLQSYIDSGSNGRQFVDTFFTQAGELGQGGANIDSDGALRSKIIQDYMQKLQPQQISGSPNFSMVGGGTNQASGTRAQRNNNPLNIKSSQYTNSYSGVVGIDPSPASDGGNFLVFNSPAAGFQGAAQLLKASGYQNLTVDGAMKRWSNSGYGGNIMPHIANKPMSQLTQNELSQLVQAMARAEGYYA